MDNTTYSFIFTTVAALDAKFVLWLLARFVHMSDDVLKQMAL